MYGVLLHAAYVTAVVTRSVMCVTNCMPVIDYTWLT